MPHRQPPALSRASALRTITTEKAGLAALEEALKGELGHHFSVAVDAIIKAPGRVLVTGMGKSGHIGRKLAATLASTGQPAHFVHPGEASHGDLGMIQPDDVIIAMSWSGESSELIDVIAYAKQYQVTLIGITSRAESSLGRGADICLLLPPAKEACPNGLAPTTSTTMQLALGDAIAIALLEARRFEPHDFGRYHPGGKLGARLKQVSAIMQTGTRLPLVKSGTLMADAIVTMTSKGLGCAIIVDESDALKGIITDGDLRRHMAPELISKSVDEIMTKAPQTIAPDNLIAEALDILEARKISSLVVVDAAKPVGLLHLLDLLRIGAA